MNKKGFTLVELMAVIVLIGLIASLASIPITRSIKKHKQDMYERQKEQIILAANSWVIDNPYLLPPYIERNSVQLTIDQLRGYLGDKIIDPRTDKEISNCSYVEVTLNEKILDSDKNVYKYQFYEQESC